MEVHPKDLVLRSQDLVLFGAAIAVEVGLGLFLVAVGELYQDPEGQYMDPYWDDVAHEEEAEMVAHCDQLLDILSFEEHPALDLDHVEVVELGHVPALVDHKDLEAEVVD